MICIYVGFDKCIELIFAIMVYFNEQKFFILSSAYQFFSFFWFVLSEPYLKVFA